MGIIYKNGTYYGGGSGGGGAEITVDNELSSTSENPVQNKVIKAELDNKQDADDLMTSADMDDVVTPLPGVASRLPRYSTEEQIVGYWIDGKPLYQKVVDCGAIPDNTQKTVSHGGLNIDTIFLKSFFATNDSKISLTDIWWQDGHMGDQNYRVFVGGEYIYIKSTYNFSRFYPYSYAIICYTKTTD